MVPVEQKAAFNFLGRSEHLAVFDRGRTSPGSLNPYLALATANNRFNSFNIRPKKHRFIGNLVILAVIMASSILTFFGERVSRGSLADLPIQTRIEVAGENISVFSQALRLFIPKEVLAASDFKEIVVGGAKQVPLETLTGFTALFLLVSLIFFIYLLKKRRALLRKLFKTFFIFTLILVWFVSGWPPIWRSNSLQLPPKIQEVEAAGLMTKMGTLSQPTSTGNQQITGVGFQPEALIFWMTNLTAEGNGASSYLAKGFTDGTNQGSTAVAWQDGFNTVQDRTVATKVISLVNETGTVLAEAGIVSLDTDGFTINWTTVDSTQRLVTYLALGGTSFTNVKVGSVTGTTSPLAVSGVGFQPDAVLLVGRQDSTLGTGTRGQVGYGIALSTTSRHTSGARERSNGAGSSGLYSVEFFSPADDLYTTPAETRWDLQSMDTDGFTLVQESGTQATTIGAIYMALKGAGISQGILTQPTTTG